MTTDTATAFHGWPQAAVDFYEGLEVDNSKGYWTEHKSVYDESVLAPMTALLGLLAGEFGEAKVLRPYRDVRFSADKTRTRPLSALRWRTAATCSSPRTASGSAPDAT